MAASVLAAIGPDNDGYVEAERQGTKLVFRMSSESAGTLRNTADDLMACLKVAEEVVITGRRRSAAAMILLQPGIKPID